MARLLDLIIEIIGGVLASLFRFLPKVGIYPVFRRFWALICQPHLISDVTAAQCLVDPDDTIEYYALHV